MNTPCVIKEFEMRITIHNFSESACHYVKIVSYSHVAGHMPRLFSERVSGFEHYAVWNSKRLMQTIHEIAHGNKCFFLHEVIEISSNVNSFIFKRVSLLTENDICYLSKSFLPLNELGAGLPNIFLLDKDWLDHSLTVSILIHLFPKILLYNLNSISNAW